jgi:DNA-binding NtrC family response regulator
MYFGQRPRFAHEARPKSLLFFTGAMGDGIPSEACNMQHGHEKTRKPSALLLAMRPGACQDAVSLLERRGVRVTERELSADALRFSVLMRPDLILIEGSVASCCDWQHTARELRQAQPGTPVILLMSGGNQETAIAALRLGFHDYLSLPVQPDALFEALDRFLTHAARPEEGPEPACDPMVGNSEILARVKSYMMRAAASDCTVLITGETGTGKELAAEFIHRHSTRRSKPLVCVNCAAIPDPLLESELFGHARGAFTGADNVRDGLLASAEGGTVLLDEIGDMSLSAQAKILRVLERKEVSRLGGAEQRRIDVRFVAATNQDLENMADRGAFRRDLFYRLNVARVELPPLRDRKEDIPLLVEYYRSQLGGGDVTHISEACLRRISGYDWPGNIRELRNVLESVFLHCQSGEVQEDDLPRRLREATDQECRLAPGERERLVEALCATQWNKSRAAERLHWSRMTLYRKMAKYRVTRLPAPVRDLAV